MKIILFIALLLGPLAFANDSEADYSVNNWGAQLDCDTSVPGAVCPSKPSPNNLTLTNDTLPTEQSDGTPVKANK
ncbi:MAG: hypothetical protein V4596_05265 [Bdellovibrionota bacterium]